MFWGIHRVYVCSGVSMRVDVCSGVSMRVDVRSGVSTGFMYVPGCPQGLCMFWGIY